MKKILNKIITLSLYFFCVSSLPVNSASQQDTNDCMTATGDFCQRSGSCSIQGANWYQYVTVDKSDIFDTQGWPGVCDMVHVALVQGNCSPPQSTTNIIAYLSVSSFADIPEILGPLHCGADLIADGDVAPLNAPDGVINAADLLIMTQIVTGTISPEANTVDHGDVYPTEAPDGVITISDLLLLFQLAINN